MCVLSHFTLPAFVPFPPFEIIFTCFTCVSLSFPVYLRQRSCVHLVTSESFLCKTRLLYFSFAFVFFLNFAIFAPYYLQMYLKGKLLWPPFALCYYVRMHRSSLSFLLSQVRKNVRLKYFTQHCRSFRTTKLPIIT